METLAGTASSMQDLCHKCALKDTCENQQGCRDMAEVADMVIGQLKGYGFETVLAVGNGSGAAVMVAQGKNIDFLRKVTLSLIKTLLQERDAEFVGAQTTLMLQELKNIGGPNE